ncbi:phage virion morphogenesis protein [Pseudomonas fluorescens]|uniref:phage virion morphogenesis protein n=1 Tax=Pseudomonas fluorescens TaxID=294 RepID=UPI00069A48FF|nr:phage virion morphogenesis protein [Pseudomonas fluorescens]
MISFSSGPGAPPVELEINTAQLQALADKVKRLGPRNPHIKQGLNQIGVRWVARIKANFRKSVDPYGGSWPGISHRQGQPLIDTGRLLNSIKHQVDDLDLDLGSNLIYADNHQYGITVKRRAFFPDSRGLPKQWLEEYEKIMVEQIEKALA